MRKSLIERAYELARSGRFTKVEALKTTLRREGYDSGSVDAMFGKALRTEIKTLMNGHGTTAVHAERRVALNRRVRPDVFT